ncbi:MAG: hypothetical protein ACW98D_20845 [Promethearchaeota archaeon]|jgi:hypothetical protein
MSVKDYADFHNRFDPISDVDLNLVPSDIGPDVNWSRPGIYKQYRDAKFNKGVDIPLKPVSTADDYITGSGFTFNFNRCASTFWTIPDTDVVNGVVQGTGPSSRHGYFSKNLDSINNFMSFVSFGTDIGFTQFFTRVNGVSYNYNVTTGFNMTAGQLYSIAVFLDRTGIGATSEVLRIYLNKVKVYSSTLVSANQTLTSGTLNYGAGINNGIYAVTFQYDGVLDNPKDFNSFPSKITEQNVNDVLDNLDIERFVGVVPSNAFNNGLNEGYNEALN